MAELPQHFQSQTDQIKLKELMRPYGEENWNREMLNIGGTPSITPAFEPEWLQPLRDRSNDFVLPTNGREPYRYFFVSCDPAGEGFSQSVFTSMLFDTETSNAFVPYTAVVRFRSFSFEITRHSRAPASRAARGCRHCSGCY